MKLNISGSWIIFIVLSVIWGSSFVLMKEGLTSLSAYQVASLRIFTAGLVLAPFANKAAKTFSRKSLAICCLAGLLGNLFPAFLFCIAEEKVDSALAGMLNSLTPVFAIVLAALFFSTEITRNKLIGVIIAFGGAVILFLSGKGLETGVPFGHAMLIVLATFFYGLNANIVANYLKGHSTLLISGFSVFTSGCIALLVLIFTGYFERNIFTDPAFRWSTLASVILGVFGSAAATVLYFRLIASKGVVFSSMVTYAIPFVALIWGIFYGEKISSLQILGFLVMLGGVYIVNKRKTA